MLFHIKKVEFRDHLLSRLADDLLSALPDAVQGDLSAALVVLPSARACRTLGHVLLEKSARDTLLLPRAVTPRQLLEEEAAVQGLPAVDLPDDATRPMILAHELEKLPWLQDRPENGPGLAREFLAFFDEARLYGRGDLLPGEGQVDQVVAQVVALGHPGAAEVLASDVKRLGEVWTLYRRVVPRDAVDLLVEAAAGAEGRARPARALVAVAGFGRLDPVTAQLVRVQAEGCDQAWLYQPAAEGLLARFFTATWGEGGRGLGPLAPSGQVRQVLTGEAETEPAPVGSLRRRLDELGPLDSLWAPEGPLEMAVCANQEQESRFVAHRVVQILSQDQVPAGRTAVVTNDPVLAARVVAQLRDAGIDVDDTLGRPVAGLPAGLLLRFMLRAALTGLRPPALFEVLTHPYTRRKDKGTGREFATLSLERMLRSQQTLPAGPGELLRLARERDEAASRAYGDNSRRLEGFVQEMVDGFQPLLDLAAGEHPAVAFIAALRRAWQLLAPNTALTEDRTLPDVTAVDRLLTRLDRDHAWLPDTSLAAFAGDLNRLLAEENVAPHRTQGLPVLVAGLVEARLETYDNLIIAGLNEGKFPSRRQRPLFLDSRVRGGLQLPLWKDALARDAELFLRLLHNAPRVLLTWSAEEGGAQVLPSPLVERLLLGRTGNKAPAVEPPAPIWRRDPAPMAVLQVGQESFAAESLDVPAWAAPRPLHRLSWSGLRTWRECPYRFLLERGFALRKEEEVQEEFSRRDSGSLIHEVLRLFLEPDGAGFAALAAGRREQAQTELERLARAEFTPPGRVLPARVLWLNSFLEWVPGLVDCELERFARWRPVLLEERFVLPLPRLVQWIQATVTAGGAVGDVPELTDEQTAIELEGGIDRVDLALGGQAECAVIDYKTGKVPGVKQVTDLRELQVMLYSLAVETGALPLPGAVPQVTEAFYYAVGGDLIGPPSKPHFDGDRQLLLDAATALVDMACRAAAGGPFALLPEQRTGQGPTQPPCGFCDFQGVCRLEERSGLPAALQVKVDKLPAGRKGGRY